jgi:hypothetical protein
MKSREENATLLQKYAIPTNVFDIEQRCTELRFGVRNSKRQEEAVGVASESQRRS